MFAWCGFGSAVIEFGGSLWEKRPVHFIVVKKL